MRNILEFPVTLTEVIECLQRLEQEALKTDRIGDMTPVLLHRARQIVERERFYHDDSNPSGKG